MRNLRVILIIFTVALLIIIGLIIIKFHKPNKLNVSENVIKGYDISFKNEEQTKTFIDSNYNLKAAAALDKVYRDEHITPDNQEEFEKIFKAAYESISDEEINNEKTEKLQVLNELITDKDYTLKDTKEVDIGSFNTMPLFFKAYESSYESEDHSKLVINYATYEDKIVSIISIYTEEN